ncbi:MAG TPA: CDP-alcohol phosphatidyltransferase family protein [Allosphingosinicella sp.]|nr:CDP-alcohol phosphatidyltransferase family protein [Allosphingosinicella sp.]HKT15178.1 CDP-alcohol phosphatidyltransferase family protein [Allosphingosinicella sp.]
MSVDERVRRLAKANRLAMGPTSGGDSAALLVNRHYVFDPAWLRILAVRPGDALTLDGKIAIAHCRDPAERSEAAAAIESDRPLPAGSRLAALAHEQGGAQLNSELRKREQPFLLRLEPGTVRAAERASYFGAYKGVTDLLTKYLWPEWALVLTRIAARFGISPNAVTALGAALCVAAAILFWHGHYWAGMLAGLVFMVLDTVDGKLARCTITSSKWGNIFDHGIDLIHPPFWWYAWGVGLAAYGRPLAPDAFWWAMTAIIGGYAVQRLIEGIFMRRFGMHIHVWERIDSRFRLITARRNPNMVILFAATLVARPDLGLIGIAWWTLVSCLFHLVRLIQAFARQAQGRDVRSWLG